LGVPGVIEAVRVDIRDERSADQEAIERGALVLDAGPVAGPVDLSGQALNRVIVAIPDPVAEGAERAGAHLGFNGGVSADRHRAEFASHAGLGLIDLVDHDRWPQAHPGHRMPDHCPSRP
jgi:hypothetical protein